MDINLMLDYGVDPQAAHQELLNQGNRFIRWHQGTTSMFTRVFYLDKQTKQMYYYRCWAREDKQKELDLFREFYDYEYHEPHSAGHFVKKAYVYFNTHYPEYLHEDIKRWMVTIK